MSTTPTITYSATVARLAGTGWPYPYEAVGSLDTVPPVHCCGAGTTPSGALADLETWQRLAYGRVVEARHIVYRQERVAVGEHRHREWTEVRV